MQVSELYFENTQTLDFDFNTPDWIEAEVFVLDGDTWYSEALVGADKGEASTDVDVPGGTAKVRFYGTGTATVNGQSITL